MQARGPSEWKRTAAIVGKSSTKNRLKRRQEPVVEIHRITIGDHDKIVRSVRTNDIASATYSFEGIEHRLEELVRVQIG